MIEAMACGTPVIAYRSGSVPEIIEEEVTGFIVKTRTKQLRLCRGLGKSIEGASARASKSASRQSEWHGITCATIAPSWSGKAGHPMYRFGSTVL